MIWSPFVFDEADIRTWDDGAVVYVRRNGDTHRITLLAAEILFLLINRRCASDEMIVADLSDDLISLGAGERDELVYSALSSLNQAGLIGVVTEC